MIRWPGGLRGPPSRLIVTGAERARIARDRLHGSIRKAPHEGRRVRRRQERFPRRDDRAAVGSRRARARWLCNDRAGLSRFPRPGRARRADRRGARESRRRRRCAPRRCRQPHQGLDSRDTLPAAPRTRRARSDRDAGQWRRSARSALVGDRGGSPGRVLRRAAGDDPERARIEVSARRDAPGLCLALQRPRHFLPRAPGIRSRAGCDLGRRAAHGAKRHRRERRDVHARYRVRLPRCSLHHGVMGPRRAGRAGRGEPRRILRIQARAAGRSRGDHPAQPRVEGLPHGLRGGTRSRPLGRGRGGRGKRPRALLHRRQGHSRARAPGTRHRVALRLPDGHRVGQGWRDRRDLRPAGAARNRAKPRRPLDPAIHAEAAIEGARPGPRDRAANRLRAGARRVRRPRDVAHPAGRRASSRT